MQVCQEIRSPGNGIGLPSDQLAGRDASPENYWVLDGEGTAVLDHRHDGQGFQAAELRLQPSGQTHQGQYVSTNAIAICQV